MLFLAMAIIQLINKLSFVGCCINERKRGWIISTNKKYMQIQQRQTFQKM